jgi:type IV pilus assembly protein PilW
MRPIPQRGFTLIELLVALTVTAFVMVAVFAAVNSQQKSYFDGQMQRTAQGSARSALLYMEQRLRLAGYGVEPSFAFDFGTYAGPCPAENAGCPRDSTTNNDEVVFYSRNPSYWVPADPFQEPRGHAWRVRSISASEVRVNARQGDVFPKGQVLSAVCRGGEYYAYMTVSQTIGPVGADTMDLPIPLEATSIANPLRRQDVASNTAAWGSNRTSCFSDGLARLFQVDRYRFHVRPVALGTGGGRTLYAPYLVLDMGVDVNGDGVVDEQDEMLVSEGVEVLQIGYVLANPNLPGLGVAAPFVATPAGAGGFGVTTSNTLTTSGFPGAAPATTDDSPYKSTSSYAYLLGPPSDPQRLTNHQANIRQVRLAVVTRSPSADTRSRTAVLLDSTFRLFDLVTVPAWISANADPGPEDGFQRMLSETRVVLPNMMARGLTYF